MKKQKKRGRWLLICVGFLYLMSLALSLEGCGCSVDQDCPNSLRCGPGGVCLYRCFPGETSACVAGFVCNSTGDGCTQSTTPSPDAGTKD